MSRRIFALIMTFVMIFSLLPVSAFAEEVTDGEVLPEEQLLEEELPVPEGESAEEPEPMDAPETKDAPEVPAVTVRFSCTPADAEVNVFDAAGEAAFPEEDGSYLLLPGDYTYTASCAGYVAVENISFTVTAGSGETVIDVVLEAAAALQSVAGKFNGSPAELDADGNLLIDPANFPDEAFRSYVSENFDVDKDGVLTVEEAAGVTRIDCNGVVIDNGSVTRTGNIESLRGIEYFTELDYLNCSGNQLDELDVSKNIALTYLDCGWNMLTSLTIYNENLTYLQCGSNKLTSLDVGDCPALQSLYCTSGELSSLDVSRNTALEVLATGGNPITYLDVSENTGLRELYCYNNALTYLDLSRNTALEKLNCANNALKTLDLSKNTALSEVNFGSQRGSASAYWENGELIVDLGTFVGKGNLAKITNVSVDGSYDAATGIFTPTGDPEQTGTFELSYSFDTGAPTDSTLLDVTLTVSVPGEQLFNGSPAELDANGNLLINAANFPDEAFRSYVSENFDADNDGALTVDEAAAVYEISCSDLGITSLEGVEYFVYLQSLFCYNNQLTELDISKNKDLVDLDVQNGKLTSLDVSSNPALKYLVCNRNQLSSLDVSVNSEIDWLQCSDNQLMELNVQNNPKLATLYCAGNLLMELNVQNNPKLADMFCANNRLTELDISQNPELVFLNCSNNQLTELDMSGKTAMDYLNCSGNRLKALDVSDNTKLTRLLCGVNELTFLDLSKNTALSEVNFGSQRSSASAYRENGKLIVDLGALVGKENIAKITNVSGDGSYDAATGIFTLTGDPEQTGTFELSYSFDTGAPAGITPLAVTLTVFGPGTQLFNGSPAELDANGNLLINEVNFPAETLRSYVSSCFDKDDDGALTVDEAAASGIGCINNGISDIKGVEYFPGLIDLHVYNNQLTELDLSKNTALMSLFCAGNQLTSLDLSRQPAMRVLDCGNNQLTELDTSLFSKLGTLACSGNSLTSLDVSKNTALEYLNCSNNALMSLDLSNNTALTTLKLSSQHVKAAMRTENGKRVLDLGALIGMDNIARVSNVTYGVLDASTGIITLDDNKAEIAYSFDTGAPSVKDASMRVFVQDSAVDEFNGSPAELDANGNLLINAANFPDEAFRSYVSENFDADNDGALTVDEAAAVYEISCSDLGITSLEGIEYFVMLNNLQCIANQLTELDLSHNTNLIDLDCSENRLTELDLSHNTNLASLACYDNGIDTLNLSACTSLKQLNCSNNRLTELDVSGNTELGYLVCYGNQLTSLDVSQNTALTNLECSENELTTLDVSSNSALTGLFCRENNLTSLDVSQNTALNNLECGGNALETLDVSGNTELWGLYCSDNRLTTLDVSGNTGLWGLACNNNQLTSLDVSQNTELFKLLCGGNLLETLDMSRNTKLNTLHCYNNQLTSLDLSNNTALSKVNFASQRGSASAYRENGELKVDLGALVGKENIAKITNVSVDGSYDAATGIFTLTGDPEQTGTFELSYSFDTGAPAGITPLDVTLTVSVPGEQLFNGSPAELDANGNLLINAANFPDEAFRSYVSENFDADNDGVLTVDEAAAVYEISCSDLGITSLEGIEYFVMLNNLQCIANQLTELDLSRNTNLTDLDCSENRLTELDLSHNTNLVRLACDDNGIGTLNLSACPSLKQLICSSNRLTELDISGNTELETLNCYGNQLTSLDVSQNTALTTLECGENRLTSLDVSGSAKLRFFYCYNNQLTSLDLSKNTALSEVNFGSQRSSASAYWENGKLKVDLGALVGKENIAKITNVSVDGSYDAATGIFTLTGNPKQTGSFELSYSFDTGAPVGGTPLDVTLNVSYEPAPCTHSLVTEPAVAATCTEPGRTESVYCSICGEVFTEAKVIPALGHNFGEWVQTKAPTLTADGAEMRKCQNPGCTEKETRVIEHIVYVVSYDANGGTRAPAAQKLLAGNAVKLSTSKPAYTGYAFMGWATDPAATAVEYVPGESVTPESSLTLYAVWKPLAQSIELRSEELGEGDISGASISVDMAVYPSVSISAAAQPEDAAQEFTWKSSSTSVAKVDAEGIVTFVKPGTVTVTASAKDGSGKSANVKLTVIFKNEAKSFTAKLGETSLVYAQSTKIGLQLGDSAQIDIFGTDKTAALDNGDFTFTSNNAGVSVDENGTVKAEKAGVSAKITAVMTGDPLNRKATVTVKTVPVQTLSVTVAPSDKNDESLLHPDGLIGFHGVDAAGNLCAADGAEAVSWALYVKKIPSGQPAQDYYVDALLAKVDGTNDPSGKGSVTWASTAAGVAAVKEADDGSGIITIKANTDGACAVTATSKDLGKAQGSIAVYVIDYTPRLGSASLTLDSTKVGNVVLPLVSSYENWINDVRFTDTKGDERTDISVNHDPYTDQWILTANDYIANTTIRGQLVMDTDQGEYTLPLNVTVKNSMPKISFKQVQKFDLFYTNSWGVFTVTAGGANIAEAYVDPSCDPFEGSMYISGADNNPYFGVWYREGAEIPAKPNTKLKVMVMLEDYVNPIPVNVTLGTELVKPNISLMRSSETINAAYGGGELYLDLKITVGKDSGTMNMKSPNRGDEDPSTYWDVSVSPAIADIDVAKTDYGYYTLKVTYNEASQSFKGGRVTISIKYDGWTQAITLPLNVTVSNTLPAVKLNNGSSISLNSQYPNAAGILFYDMSSANTTCSNIEYAFFTPDRAGTDADKIRVDINNGWIAAWIVNPNDVPKPGSYRFSINPRYTVTDEEHLELAKISVTVTVTDKLPATKLDKTAVTLNNRLPGKTESVNVIATDKQLNPDIYRNVRYEVERVVHPDGLIVDIDGCNVTVRIDPINPLKAGSYKLSLYPACGVSNGNEQDILTRTLSPLTLTVKVTDTQPQGKLSKSSLKLNRAVTALTDSAVLTSTDSNYTVAGMDYEVKSTGAAAAEADKIALEYNDGTITAVIDELNNPPKAGKYSYTVTGIFVHKDTGDRVKAKPLTLTVNVGNTLPTAKADVSTLKLSTLSTIAGKEQAYLHVIPAAGYTVTGLRELSILSTGAAGAEAGKINVSVSGAEVSASLDAEDLPKAGTYKYSVKPVVVYGESGVEIELAAVSFSVNVYAGKTPSATISVSGKLDAVQRANSQITYTLTKLNNISGVVDETSVVKMIGENAEMFEITAVDVNAKGQPYVTIRLRDEVPVSTAVTYKVGFSIPVLGTEEPIWVDTAIQNVKVTSSAIKAKAEPSTQTVFQSQSRYRSIVYAVTLSSPAHAKLGSVEINSSAITGLLRNSLVNAADNIEVINDKETDTAYIVVTVKDTSALTAGKTYTLPLLIKADGQAENTAASKLSLNLKVMK